jgi:cephalosporin hydroxylase
MKEAGYKIGVHDGRHNKHEDYEAIFDANVLGAYYNYVHKVNGGEYQPRWRGVKVVKHATDLILYAQAIWKNQPTWIVETGTKYGGSGLFFADMLALCGGKGVITIDVVERDVEHHPYLECITASSTDEAMFDVLRRRVRGSSVMVVLDSDHSTKHVARELELYSQIVTEGQFLVVEDCWAYRTKPYPPHKAVEAFLKTTDQFEREDVTKQFVFGVTRDGWLRRAKDGE